MQRRILELVERQPCSRMEVARQLGMRPNTVGDLVAELIERRLLCEAGVLRRGKGKPATMLELDRGYHRILGLELMPERRMLVIGDLLGNVVAERRLVEHAPAAIAVALQAAMAELPARQPLIAAVASGGILDRQTGQVLEAVNYPELVGHSAAGLVGWAGPTLLLRSNNAMAEAERRVGEAQDSSNFLFARFGSGVGCALVVDGRFVHGSLGVAGELGHMALDASAAPCRCGRNGCLEAVASEYGIARALTAARGANPPGQFDAGAVTMAAIGAAAASDSVVSRVLTNAGSYAGQTLAEVVNLLGLDLVVLAGSVVQHSAIFRAALAKSLRQRLAPRLQTTCQIRFSTLEDTAAATGAMLGARQHFFANPQAAISCEKTGCAARTKWLQASRLG